MAAAEKVEGKVLFKKNGVFIHTTVVCADEDALVAGVVFLLEKPQGIFIEWKALDDLDSPPKDNEWTVVDTVGYKPDKNGDASVSMKSKPSTNQTKYVINFDIKDLKSFNRSKPNLGWSYLIFILQCGTTFPALHFHQGGTKAMIKELEKYLIIKRSPSDSCLYLVKEHDPQALTRSFDELQLFEQQASDIVTKFINDPYTATLGGFSKVTNFLRDTLMTPEDSSMHRSHSDALSVSRLLEDDLPGIDINNQEEPGFEVVTTRELPDRPQVKRIDPLSPQEWARHMDKDGRIMGVDQIKSAVFRGGVDPSIRIEVWKFLLGYYPWDSTYKTRTEQRKKKVDEYFSMKLQWKSVSEEQEKRFGLLKERKSLIDKDVFRTDRTHHYYHGDDNPNIRVLYDILMTYCMYNFDLGYVQGMSDLLSPILVVMENEVDAFWCLAGFMELVCHNFDMDQAGMKKQLLQLNNLVRFLDPMLHNYLESQDSSNMYFCFRWLLIVFKREFSFNDIMRLWEVYWTGLPCKNFHLIMCVSILDSAKNTLIENNFGFTEILKHINDMSTSIDLEDMLKRAEGIFLQVYHCKDVPDGIREILGMEIIPPSKSSSGSGTPNTSTPSASTPSTPDRSRHQPNGRLNTVTFRNGTVTTATTPEEGAVDMAANNMDLVY